MNVTDIVAWWGASIATLVLAWDIYKWERTGPIVKVSVSPNMKLHHDGGPGRGPHGLRDKTLVIITVTNTGDRVTTLTHLMATSYRSFYRKLRKKKSEGILIFSNHGLTGPLPYVLPPGQRWQGYIEQNVIEQMDRNNYLYCCIAHSSKNKPVWQRIILDNVEESPDSVPRSA
jgi:hypothetical protein